MYHHSSNSLDHLGHRSSPFSNGTVRKFLKQLSTQGVGEKIAIFDLAVCVGNGTRKAHIADRSVSVSMPLNDLEMQLVFPGVSS